MEHVDYHEYKMDTMTDELVLHLKYHRFSDTPNFIFPHIERMRGPVEVIRQTAVEAGTRHIWCNVRHPTAHDIFLECVKEIEADLKHIAEKYPAYTRYIFAPMKIGQFEDIKIPNDGVMHKSYFLRYGKWAGPELESHQ